MLLGRQRRVGSRLGPGHAAPAPAAEASMSNCEDGQLKSKTRQDQTGQLLQFLLSPKDRFGPRGGGGKILKIRVRKRGKLNLIFQKGYYQFSKVEQCLLYTVFAEKKPDSFLYRKETDTGWSAQRATSAHPHSHFFPHSLILWRVGKVLLSWDEIPLR